MRKKLQTETGHTYTTVHSIQMRTFYISLCLNLDISFMSAFRGDYTYSPAHELLSTRIFANIREFSRIFANEKKKKKKKKYFF